MEDRRRWIVRRVWVADADGTKRRGTAWWFSEAGLGISPESRRPLGLGER